MSAHGWFGIPACRYTRRDEKLSTVEYGNMLVSIDVPSDVVPHARSGEESSVGAQNSGVRGESSQGELILL